MWERTFAFVKRASTVILISSILFWLLLAIPIRGGGSFADTDVNDSLFAGLSGRDRAGVQARRLWHLAGVRFAGHRDSSPRKWWSAL